MKRFAGWRRRCGSRSCTVGASCTHLLRWDRRCGSTHATSTSQNVCACRRSQTIGWVAGVEAEPSPQGVYVTGGSLALDPSHPGCRRKPAAWHHSECHDRELRGGENEQPGGSAAFRRTIRVQADAVLINAEVRPGGDDVTEYGECRRDRGLSPDHPSGRGVRARSRARSSARRFLSDPSPRSGPRNRRPRGRRARCRRS